MDWAAGMEAEETMLRRIVALLYSLANLAEQAAVRSPAIRCLVLGFLRVAESVARKMVIRNSGHIGISVLDLLVADQVGETAGDAIRLARRFRELAVALESLVAPILVAGRRGQASSLQLVRQTMTSTRPLLDCLSKRLDLKRVASPDTS